MAVMHDKTSVKPVMRTNRSTPLALGKTKPSDDIVEDVEQLRSTLEQLLKFQTYDVSRRQRIETLLGRKHAVKLKPGRKAKLVSRLMASVDRLTAVETDIDMITHRIEQHVEET